MATRSTTATGGESPILAGGDPALLVRALALGASGEPAWREWRAGLDLDRIPWPAMQILPSLNGLLTPWLNDDPAAGILMGIVRRAWTETQVRLAAAQAAAEQLETAGCGPVLLAGSTEVSLRARSKGSIRAIYEIRLLIPRHRLVTAAATLQQDGWRLHGSLPSGDALDWVREVYFSRGALHLFLQWRLAMVPAEKASRYEADLFLPATAEHTLLGALCGRSDPDQDVVPWQVDAVLAPWESLDKIRFAALADSFAPLAFERLDQLRALGLAVPGIARPQPPRPPRRWFPFARGVFRYAKRRIGGLRFP